MSEPVSPPETSADWGIDLTAEARAGRLDPLIGREAILERVLLVLARKTKNNPVLLGPPGVGKTALAEGLAARLVAGDVPPRLRGRELYSLHLGNLLAGTGYRGDFELRLRRLVQDLRRPARPRMLFVDELHLLARAGKSEGGLDAANLLKPLLARGELPCLGATTPSEWQELLATDPALERRFQPIEVPPATPEETRAILHGLRPNYAAYHGIEITDEALAAALRGALARPAGRLLPDRAIDLLDEACARLSIQAARLGSSPHPAPTQRQALVAALDRFDLPAVARLLHVPPPTPPRQDPRLTATHFDFIAFPPATESAADTISSRGEEKSP